MMIKSRAMVLYSNYTLESAAAAAKSLQSCPTLCDPIDGSPPGSSMGFSRQEYWSWVPSLESARILKKKKNQTKEIRISEGGTLPSKIFKMPS